jgi:hypothetical protein
MVALAIPVAASRQQARAAFEYLGEWSDVVVSKTEDPHASGNSLQLWKDNGAIVGVLSEYVGPVADPPIGPIQDVKFDATSRQFSFTVKLSLGVTVPRGQQAFVATREFYVFAGILGEQDVRGSLDKHDRLGNNATVTRDVVWKRQSGIQESLWRGKTLAEWRDFYAPILRARGPKW